jgi:hypothetical protein
MPRKTIDLILNGRSKTSQNHHGNKHYRQSYADTGNRNGMDNGAETIAIGL